MTFALALRAVATAWLTTKRNSAWLRAGDRYRRRRYHNKILSIAITQYVASRSVSNSYNSKDALREIRVHRFLRRILLANKGEIVMSTTKRRQDRQKRITELAGLNSLEEAEA
ncbi:uncharacterized protein LOC120356978 [Solenopsis invicta]|uniref:uncharacterized protein LOC120356978 n=1 Tax=Solenopsis invicta TaxID=13686 RepID=UPI00193CEFEF|nr:uncharacterized protein LOC120356978 [Solenopsis invicta]